MVSKNLIALDNDFSVFHRGNLIITVYVDDLLIIDNNKTEIAEFK